MRSASLALALLALALAPAIGSAQASQQPGAWLERPDSASPSQHPSYRFDEMPPGFHITTQGTGLLVTPGTRAEGRYRLEAELYLFPGEGADGYGLFIGGAAVEHGPSRYVAFVLRRDGEAAVFQRDGADSTLLLPWTRPDSARAQSGNEPAANLLAIHARSDSVVFLVNGRPVGALDRGQSPIDGQFGYRIGPALSVHATTLDFTRPLAPGR
jgi:hypothetical protein